MKTFSDWDYMKSEAIKYFSMESDLLLFSNSAQIKIFVNGDRRFIFYNSLNVKNSLVQESFKWHICSYT